MRCSEEDPRRHTAESQDIIRCKKIHFSITDAQRYVICTGKENLTRELVVLSTTLLSLLRSFVERKFVGNFVALARRGLMIFV